MATTTVTKDCVKTQRRYDRLHHLRRHAWLSADKPLWGCGTPVSPSDQAMLLHQSMMCLMYPSQASRSVDLNDHQYLAELDAFERTTETQG